jgi:hypothetical protein
MATKFIKKRHTVYIDVRHPDPYLYDEISRLLLMTGYTVSSNLNIPESDRSSRTMNFSLHIKAIREKIVIFSKIKLRRVALRLYLLFREFSLSRRFVLNLKNRLVKYRGLSSLLIPSEYTQNQSELIELKEFEIDQVPCIFLASVAEFQKLTDFASSHGLSTLSIPSSNLFIVMTPREDYFIHECSNVHYPMPYNYIKNSYFIDSTNALNSIILIVDFHTSLDVENIYLKELSLLSNTLRLTKIVFVSMKDDIPLESRIYNSLEIQRIGLSSFNFSQFKNVRDIIQEDSIIVGLSETQVPWISNYSSISGIPYLDLSNIPQSLHDSDFLKLLVTPLGKIRALSLILPKADLAAFIKIGDPTIEVSETQWRECLEVFISKFQ